MSGCKYNRWSVDASVVEVRLYRSFRKEAFKFVHICMKDVCWPAVTYIGVCVSRDSQTWKCYTWSRWVKTSMSKVSVPKVRVWRFIAGELFGVVKRAYCIMGSKVVIARHANGLPRHFLGESERNRYSFECDTKAVSTLSGRRNL